KAEFESITRGQPVPALAARPPGAGQAGVDLEDVRRQLRSPAIGLALVGGLNCYLLIALVLVALFLNFFPDRAPSRLGMRELLLIGLSAPLGPVILRGARAMSQVRRYGLALTGCILAMMPCGLCWLVTMPIGLWGLTVLLQPQVRA